MQAAPQFPSTLVGETLFTPCVCPAPLSEITCPHTSCGILKEEPLLATLPVSCPVGHTPVLTPGALYVVGVLSAVPGRNCWVGGPRSCAHWAPEREAHLESMSSAGVRGVASISFSWATGPLPTPGVLRAFPGAHSPAPLRRLLGREEA